MARWTRQLRRFIAAGATRWGIAQQTRASGEYSTILFYTHAQIKLGATTFWEVSHPDWLNLFRSGPSSEVPEPIPYGENGATSLCHPWSAGAAPWLSMNVLGVSPATPGFGSVRIAPHLTPAMVAGGGLSGSVPSPHGPIHVSIFTPTLVAPAKDASIEVSIPVGCSGGVHLELSRVLLARLGWGPQDLGLRPITSPLPGEIMTLEPPPLRVNGAHFRANYDAHRGSLVDENCPAMGRCGAWVLDLPPGKHTITPAIVSARGPTEAPLSVDPFPPLAWPSRFIGVDTHTRGNWIGRFGGAGFVFFDFNASGTVQVLPPFIVSAKPIEGLLTNWQQPPPANDTRALQDPSDGNRGIGCAYAALTYPGMTLGIDVLMPVAAEGTWYQVSARVH